MRNNLISLGAVALLTVSLSACGGGSGQSVSSTPTPPAAPSTPTPTPTPTPAPTAAQVETNASAAAVSSKAQYAYDQGYTGKNVTVAVIDTGVDVDSAEFAGRISDKSKSFSSTYAACMECAPETVTYGLDDTQGHGTKVASVALGARNSTGMHGIAFDSTLLALKIVAPDLSGTITGTPREGGVNAAAVAPAIRYAVDNNAFAINISLNGTAAGQVATDLRSAMDYVRQNNRLVIQSVSNDPGNSFTGSMTENMVGTDLANQNWFLYGIALDSSLRPRDGNGTPGALAGRTLSVVGNGVTVTGLNGTETVSGNSFAAPAIAGAAALLKQYWPQLGGSEISSILLSTATDLGVAGVDQIYGVGLLNIENAFKAQAPTITTSSIKPSEVGQTALVISPAFGGSGGQMKFSDAAGQAVAIDRFGRDYLVNMGMLAHGVQASGVSIASLAQDESFSPEDEALRTSRKPFAFGVRVGKNASVTGSVNSAIDSPAMMTGSMLRSSNIATYGSQFNVQADGNVLGFGEAHTGDRHYGSSTKRFSIELSQGLILGFTRNRENGSALGMAGSGSFNIEGARSAFVTAGWAGNVAGFNLTGEAMLGRTNVSTSNALIEFSDSVYSSGFRFQADRSLFGGQALFGLTSPLKVERAQLRYTAPTAYDVATASTTETTKLIDMSASAREINLEAGWAGRLGSGSLSLGAAYGFNTGNVRGQQSAAGWLRFRTKL